MNGDREAASAVSGDSVVNHPVGVRSRGDSAMTRTRSRHPLSEQKERTGDDPVGRAGSRSCAVRLRGAHDLCYATGARFRAFFIPPFIPKIGIGLIQTWSNDSKCNKNSYLQVLSV